MYEHLLVCYSEMAMHYAKQHVPSCQALPDCNCINGLACLEVASRALDTSNSLALLYTCRYVNFHAIFLYSTCRMMLALQHVSVSCVYIREQCMLPVSDRYIEHFEY